MFTGVSAAFVHDSNFWKRRHWGNRRRLTWIERWLAWALVRVGRALVGMGRALVGMGAGRHGGAALVGMADSLSGHALALAEPDPEAFFGFVESVEAEHFLHSR